MPVAVGVPLRAYVVPLPVPLRPGGRLPVLFQLHPVPLYGKVTVCE